MTTNSPCDSTRSIGVTTHCFFHLALFCLASLHNCASYDSYMIHNCFVKNFGIILKVLILFCFLSLTRSIADSILRQIKLYDNHSLTKYKLNLLGERKQCSSRSKELNVKIAVSSSGKSIPFPPKIICNYN